MDGRGEIREQRFFRPSQGGTRRRGSRGAVIGPRYRLAAALLVLVCGAWGAAYWLTTTPRLAVRQVAFVGSERAARATLDAVGRGLRGQNLLTIDLAGIEARLKAASPWVRAASVRRKLPAGLEIVISEHRPVARLDGLPALLAPGGRPLPAEPARAGDAALPLVFLAPGTAEPRTLERTAELLGLVAGGIEPLLPRLSAIDARDPEDLALVLRDRSFVVRVGHDDFVTRLNRFRNAEPAIASRYESLATVDVRFRGRVIVAPVAVAEKRPAGHANQG